MQNPYIYLFLHIFLYLPKSWRLKLLKLRSLSTKIDYNKLAKTYTCTDENYLYFKFTYFTCRWYTIEQSYTRRQWFWSPNSGPRPRQSTGLCRLLYLIWFISYFKQIICNADFNLVKINFASVKKLSQSGFKVCVV